jgi:hypothetical protein
MITIEKNIPIPARATGRPLLAKPHLDALRTMDIGDSFVSPPEIKIAASMASVTKKTGRKFSARKISGSTRVWRIA